MSQTEQTVATCAQPDVAMRNGLLFAEPEAQKRLPQREYEVGDGLDLVRRVGNRPVRPRLHARQMMGEGGADGSLAGQRRREGGRRLPGRCLWQRQNDRRPCLELRR